MSPPTSSTETPEPFNGVPRTPDQRAGLLASRPGGWEYMLFAGDLLAGRDRLNSKWRDEELHLPRGERSHLADSSAAIHHASQEIGNIQVTIGLFNRLFAPDAHERAFGAPGEPGEQDRIEHLATRIVDAYEELLDWAAGLRACAVPEEFQKLYELLPEMASESIRAMHDFVDIAVSEMERIPDLLEAGEPTKIELTLKLSIDDRITDAASAELDQLSDS